MQNSKKGMLFLGKLIHMLFYKGTYKSIASTVKYKKIISMPLLSSSFPLSHLPQDSQPKEVHFGATQDGLSLPILINYKDNPPNRHTQDNLIVVIPQLEHSFHVVIDCVNLAVLSNHPSPMQWLFPQGAFV